MKQRKNTILFVVGIIWFGVVAPGAGDTVVGGFIMSDTQWTLANSPYVVEESIVVIAGATLTIDAGVEVRFGPDLAMVVDTGTLVARGTEASPIRFTARYALPTLQRWGYVQFSNGAVDAAFDGGGEYVSGSILEHTIVEYAGSTATDYAVRAIDSRPYIHASTIRDNARGGVFVNGSGASSTSLEDNTIQDNTTRYGVYVQSAPSVQLTGNTISDNTSGGVYLHYSVSSTLTNNTITGNTGSSDGGGVYLYSSGSSTLTNNTISGNTASSGGGVHIYSSGSSTLTNNTISGNTASSNGGGVSIYYSGLSTLTDNTITGNTGSYDGGGVYFRFSGSATLTNNTISENSADHQGGGLYVGASDDVTLTGDRITGNHTDLAGGTGGIYVSNGSDGLDLTGPDDPNSPALAVHLYGNDGYQLHNNNAFGGSFGYGDPGNVDARYVWWGTTDSTQIEVGIYDFFDDASKGVVFREPFTIPEPATVLLLLAGSVCMIGRRIAKG